MKDFIKSLKRPGNESLIESVLNGYNVIFENKIKGGKAANRKPSDFDPEQLKMGIEVEQEHTKDKKIAEEIAMDHLAEFPNYYTELKKMENKLEKENLNESVNYPPNFDVKELKNISSFAGRIRYVKSHLKKIGEGSARMVFEIDNDHVLKLAKNKKGIAQNYVEGDWGLHNMYDILPELIDKDEDDLWLIVERAKKITKKEFERLTGIKFSDFADNIRYELARVTSPRVPWGKPEDYEEIIDDEFFQDIIDMAVNFDFPSGDFEKISSYGEIDNKPVAVDVGLTKENYKEFYKR